MTAKNYSILCITVAAVTAAMIIFVPGLAESIEQSLLQFLAANARA
ncbi:MAG: hypothetical protein OXU24_14505 [Gammaproteobacteria bacterium]|nr:hypothetical protein [Gammaproteobacteria bacterium]